jgi:hypothetical protein
MSEANRLDELEDRIASLELGRYFDSLENNETLFVILAETKNQGTIVCDTAGSPKVAKERLAYWKSVSDQHRYSVWSVCKHTN